MPSEGDSLVRDCHVGKSQLGRRSAGSFGDHLGEVRVPSMASKSTSQLQQLGGLWVAVFPYL